MPHNNIKTIVYIYLTFMGLKISCVSSYDHIYNPPPREIASPSCSPSPSTHYDYQNSLGPPKEHHHQAHPSKTMTPTPVLKTPEPPQTPPLPKPNVPLRPQILDNLLFLPSWGVQNPRPTDEEKPVDSTTNSTTSVPLDFGMVPQKVLCQFGFNIMCPSPSTSVTPTPSATPSSSATPSPSPSQYPSASVSPIPSLTQTSNNSKEDEEKIDSDEANEKSEDSKNSDKDDNNSQKENNNVNNVPTVVCQPDPNEQLTCTLPSPFFVDLLSGAGCCADQTEVRDKCIESCISSLTGIDCEGVTTDNCPNTGIETIETLCNDVCDGMSEDMLFSLCTSGVEAPVAWTSLAVTRPTGNGCDASSCTKIDGDMSVNNNLPLPEDVEELSFEFPTTPNLEPPTFSGVTICVNYNACLAECEALLPIYDEKKPDQFVPNTGTHLSVGTCTRSSCSTEGKEACEKTCDAVRITMQDYNRDPDVCAQCLSDPVGQKCKVRISVTKSTDFATKTVECGVSALSLAPAGTQPLLDFTLQQTVKSL